MKNLLLIILSLLVFNTYSQGFDLKNKIHFGSNYNGLSYEGSLNITPHASYTLKSGETLDSYGIGTTISIYNQIPIPGSGSLKNLKMTIRNSNGLLLSYIWWSISADINVEAIVPDFSNDKIYFTGTGDFPLGGVFLIAGQIDMSSLNVLLSPLGINGVSNETFGKNLKLLPNGDVFVAGYIKKASYPYKELLLTQYSPAGNSFTSIAKVENFDFDPSDLLFNMADPNNIIISGIHESNVTIEQCDGYIVSNKQLCLINYDFNIMKTSSIQLINSGGYVSDVFNINNFNSGGGDQTSLVKYFNLSENNININGNYIFTGVFNGSRFVESNVVYSPIIYSFEYSSADTFAIYSSLQLSGANSSTGELSNLFNPILLNTSVSSELFITTKTFESYAGVGSAFLKYPSSGIPIIADYYQHNGYWSSITLPYGNYSASYCDDDNSVNFEVSNYDIGSPDNFNYIHANKRINAIGSLCATEYNVELNEVCSQTELISDYDDISLVQFVLQSHFIGPTGITTNEFRCISSFSNREKQSIYKETYKSTLILSVSPNPTNGEFTLFAENNSATSYNLTIRNTIGQVVYSELIAVNGQMTKKMNLTNLEKGLYFVSLENEEEKLVKKIVLK